MTVESDPDPDEIVKVGRDDISLRQAVQLYRQVCATGFPFLVDVYRDVGCEPSIYDAEALERLSKLDAFKEVL